METGLNFFQFIYIKARFLEERFDCGYLEIVRDYAICERGIHDLSYDRDKNV